MKRYEKYGKYGRKVSWIVKWYGKYRRKLWKRYEKYGRKVGRIVKWFGKYGRKVSWIVKYLENMEER